MFTTEEIDILLQAVDAWEQKDGLTGLVTLLFGAALIGDREKSEAFVNKQQAEMKAKEDSQKVRNEQAILLKAKLIHLKDKAIVQEVAETI